jgi:hypothetical protein
LICVVMRFSGPVLLINRVNSFHLEWDSKSSVTLFKHVSLTKYLHRTPKYFFFAKQYVPFMQIDPYLSRAVSQGSEGQDDRLSLYPFIPLYILVYCPC